METKQCGKCRVRFPVAAFSRQHKSKDGYQHYCRECCKALKAHYRYGITAEDLERLLGLQNHKCAVCQQQLSEKARPVIDHSHATLEVRGVLCNACNVLLGQAKDDINILQGAIRYLERRSKR